MSTQTRSPIGAALVVGGGIAGVQASIDLANAGIKVYLAEKSPAIGGKMAQLDKTFPTNDCAICIISPKLAECARHPNVTILTNAELTQLEGAAGNFTAQVRQNPRYVDMERCTACDDCTEVCPIYLPDEYNEALKERVAIYRPYAQAVPSAYAITKRGTSPCKNACPADTSAQGYVALIAQRRYAEALEVVREYNPFPATVGRVCHHPCETECNRGEVDGPVAICALKRFVADHVYEHGLEGTAESASAVKASPEAKNRPVAIVGAGPAGLSAAHFLARMGYPVTIFEALPVAGGMMRVGIPAYRLPRDVLDREIQNILDLGVDLELDTPIRNIDNLFEQGFKAVFLAIGAHQPQKLGIPGEDVEGVFHGVPFLRAVALGETAALGKNVLVVGGGNTAIDTARTAVRLGAEQVTIVYRRNRAAMPANAWEVDEAEHEGVRLELLVNPVEVLSENGRVTGVRCVRMRLGEPDRSGRPRPVTIEGSEFVRPCDARGLIILDRVFLGETEDESYRRARRNTTIVGLHCLQPDRHCFCTSLGGGPFETEGMDLALTPLEGERFFAQGLTEKGKAALASLSGKQAGAAERKALEELRKTAEAAIRRRIEVPDQQIMAEQFDSPYWGEVSRSCLTCGICSYLCPTCHCFDIVDEGYLRLRCWDTCSSDTFTRTAAGEDHRREKRSRYRQRIYHKFSYFKENFDTYSCVGCGRCTRYCPVKIDIAEIVNSIASAASNRPAAAGVKTPSKGVKR